MIIKSYEQLVKFIEKEYEENANIYKFDNDGNYTSFPNKELKKNKIIIRKKYQNIEVPKHRNEYMEIVYVLQGEIENNINGKEITMTKGDICIMDKNVMHYNKPLGKHDLAVKILLSSEVFDAVFMNILSDDNYMSNFISNSFYSTTKSKKYIIHKIEEKSFLESVIINLICEYFSYSLRSQGKINACLLLLFTELSKNLNEDEKITIDKKYSTIKIDVMNYIQKEYRDVTLLKAAEYFHFHPNYLSSLLKKEFGKNFKELIVDIRMNEAIKLLRSTDMKINLIIECIGYKNEAYFYRQFKKKYKMTPLEYREREINKS